MGPESFGIVVCRFVGTVPDILGLVWPSLRPKSGSKSKISGRILKVFGFGAMDVTKPYEFIGFGAMDVTKPYEFIGFGAL